MDRTIFLVTSGCYSDYRVESVWTTREKAEAEIQRLGRKDAEIEEYVLDSDSVARPWWNVEFYENGTRVRRVDGLIGANYMFVGKHHYQKHGNASITVQADHEGEAIKIAAERRASALAAHALHSERRNGAWEVI